MLYGMVFEKIHSNNGEVDVGEVMVNRIFRTRDRAQMFLHGYIVAPSVGRLDGRSVASVGRGTASSQITRIYAVVVDFYESIPKRWQKITCPRSGDISRL